MNDLDTVVSKLRDIHEPAAVSFWPLAPGWWALLGLLVAVPLLILGWRALRRRAKPARREALRELHQLREDYAKHGNVLRAVSEISMLIRRTCLARYPRADVAGLTGEAWLAFLDETGRTREFSTGAGRVLVSAPYQNRADTDVDALVGVTTKWLFAAK